MHRYPFFLRRYTTHKVSSEHRFLFDQDAHADNLFNFPSTLRSFHVMILIRKYYRFAQF